MKKFTAIVTLFSLCAVVAAYTDVDDSLDVDALAKDKIQTKQYMDCFLDRKPCTPQIQGYKSHLFEAMFDGCKECSDAERHMLKVLLISLRTAAKEDFEEFKAKFDPNGHIDTTFADVARF